jgi:mRNA interferase MazF
VISRGEIYVVALPGEYGKPRPAVIVQSDRFEHLPSRIVCPMTSEVRDDRTEVRPIAQPSARNGLREQSQVMVDKPHVVSTAKLTLRVGILEDDVMNRVSRMLGVVFDIV